MPSPRPASIRAALRRPPILWVLAAVAVLALAVSLVLAGTVQRGPGTQESGPPTAARPTEAAPEGDDVFRPAYHLTPDEHWMNDPQRPFFLDGLWHYYYLYNADYPEGNGTEWFHATSTDLVHWKNEGVAIPKFRNGLGDIETGSAVVTRKGRPDLARGP